MGLQSWADKKFAKGIAKAMRSSYFVCRKNMPGTSEKEILKKTVSMRPSKEAKKLLDDNSFWDDEKNINLWTVTWALIGSEYRRGYLKNNFISISQDSMNNLLDAMNKVIGESKN